MNTLNKFPLFFKDENWYYWFETKEKCTCVGTIPGHMGINETKTSFDKMLQASYCEKSPEEQIQSEEFIKAFDSVYYLFNHRKKRLILDMA